MGLPRNLLTQLLMPVERFKWESLWTEQGLSIGQSTESIRGRLNLNRRWLQCLPYQIGKVISGEHAPNVNRIFGQTVRGK